MSENAAHIISFMMQSITATGRHVELIFYNVQIERIMTIQCRLLTLLSHNAYAVNS